MTAIAQVSNYTSTLQTIQNPSYYGYPICNWNDKYSLAFLKDANGAMFSLIDHSDYFSNLSGMLPPIPHPALYEKHVSIPNTFNLYGNSYSNLTVRDIYIVDRYAFFCGTIYDETYNKWFAIYGYLILADFTNNSLTSVNVNIHLLRPDSGSGGINPDVLDRLVAYSNGTDYDIVAFGDENGMDESIGHFFCTSKIVEIHNVTQNPTVCDVADLLYVPNTARKQFVDDIFLTDNHVVFTRHNREILYYASYIHPCVSFAHKGMVVADLCNPVYNQNYYIPGYEEGNDTVVGTYLGEDRFAIAYLHYEIPELQMYTRIRTIDINSLNTSNDIQFKKSEKENPVRMIYYPEKESLVLLQQIKHASDFAVIEYPNVNSTPLTLLNTGYRNYNSLQKVVNKQSFISTNSNIVYLQNPFASFPPSSNGCPDFESIPIIPISPTTLVKEIPMTKVKNNIDVIPIPFPKINGIVKPVCSSVE